jgi:ubiquinone/menaquinone biosynthesis C-methylase UbiE
LSGFEENDYSQLWSHKRIEDEAQKRIIRSWIRQGKACLELGGGFGRITRILEPYFHDVLMIDMTKRNLEMARLNLKRASIVRGDVSTIPARDSTFDTVVMVRVAHLLPNPTRTMEEIARVSKNGGTLIMTVPNLMTNYMVRQFELKFSPKLQHAIPAFGPPAVWPLGESPRFSPDKTFVPSEFRRTERRGTGLFDNFVGKTLNGFPWLHLVDVATSPLWFFKLDIFLRYKIVK